MTIKPGAFRFNTDSMKLEIFRGSANYEGTASMAGIGTLAAGQWEEIQATSPDVLTGGTRGLFCGGINPGNVDIIDYINVATTGNAIDFGNLSAARAATSSVSSRTRGIVGGGLTPSVTDIIEFVTIASTGDMVDFGNLSTGNDHMFSACNSTRGIFAGGGDGGPLTNIIQYITMASNGDAKDFGDLTQARWGAGNGRSNSTRAVFSAGSTSPTEVNTMDFITISTQGNAADFGDSTFVGYGKGSGNAANSTRGVLMGGTANPAPVTDHITYFQFATLGSTTDFGSLTDERRGGGVVSNYTRAVYGGGRTPGETNLIDYIQIMTGGDAVDFGDLTDARSFTPVGCSNGHGGL
jgi:hypothetical protein